MKMIEVGKKGKYFTLNGVVVKPDKLIGVDGFKFCNHLFAWVKGGAQGEGGGAHLTRAKAYIEDEVLGNGCLRMRAPVELVLWGPPYFDLDPKNPAPYGKKNVANTLELVNLNSGAGSSFDLTRAMKKVIRMFVNLAREYEIVIEIPWLWTIKSEAKGREAERLGFDEDPRNRFADGNKSGVSIWNEHFMAAHGVGAYLHELRTKGDGEGISRVEPGPLNLIHDVMNEYTAHVPTVWTPGPDGQQGQVVRRMRERDCPLEEVIFLSQSGRADEYDPPLQSHHGTSGYSGPCLHPPRHGDWAKTGDVMRAKWPGELIDVNESQLGMTQAQRDFWVPMIPKWAGLGSTDMKTWRRMHENFIENDCYTTFHNFRGMDAYWPPTPETVVENVIRSITGGGGSTTPPPPEEKFRYRIPIELAYAQLLERHVDPGGLTSYDAAMAGGLKESELREGLIRSAEYKNKNPE